MLSYSRFWWTSLAVKMWKRHRCLLSIAVLCVLFFGLGNALHQAYANAEGRPDLLAKLPGELKFVHVVRADVLSVCGARHMTSYLQNRYFATATERQSTRIPRILGTTGSFGPPDGAN